MRRGLILGLSTLRSKLPPERRLYKALFRRPRFVMETDLLQQRKSYLCHYNPKGRIWLDTGGEGLVF